MRPENIGNISKSIISGMKRSLLHNQEEQSPSRTGRKGGSPTHDQVYDMLNYIYQMLQVLLTNTLMVMTRNLKILLRMNSVD